MKWPATEPESSKPSSRTGPTKVSSSDVEPVGSYSDFWHPNDLKACFSKFVLNRYCGRDDQNRRVWRFWGKLLGAGTEERILHGGKLFLRLPNETGGPLPDETVPAEQRFQSETKWWNPSEWVVVILIYFVGFCASLGEKFRPWFLSNRCILWLSMPLAM